MPAAALQLLSPNSLPESLCQPAGVQSPPV